jgi:hypothetical protein
MTGINLYDGAICNGYHNFVVNAWDTEGHLYQAKTDVTVIGLSFGPCSMPTSPGINFCAPTPGTVVPTDAYVGATATGKSPITNLIFYVNGVLAQGVNSTPPYQGNSFGVATSGNGTFIAEAPDRIGSNAIFRNEARRGGRWLLERFPVP